LKNINNHNEGTLYIEIVFYHNISNNKTRRYVNTGLKIDKKDFKKSKIITSDRTKRIRRLVEKKKYDVDETIRKIELDNGDISPEIYDKNNADNVYKKKTFDELFNMFLKEQERTKQPLTVKKHNTLKALINEYAQSLKLKELYLSDITIKFFNGFTNFLITVKDHKPSTVNKYQKSLKTFMVYINEKLDLNKDNIHKKFKNIKINDDDTSKIILTKDHIKKLKEWKPDNNSNELVRDLFMFQILTGIRYSDLLSVTKSYINNKNLSFKSFKTGKIVTIPLHYHALYILEKYDYELGEKCKTIQKYNIRLKEIAKKAGLTEKVTTLITLPNKKEYSSFELWQLITSHVGRATFITNCLVAGISPFVVMKYTGHKKLTTLQYYINIADKIAKREFDRFENYIEL
jgi:integrase